MDIETRKKVIAELLASAYAMETSAPSADQNGDLNYGAWLRARAKACEELAAELTPVEA